MDLVKELVIEDVWAAGCAVNTADESLTLCRVCWAGDVLGLKAPPAGLQRGCLP